MKKWFVAIGILVLCFSLWGCDSQEESQYDEAKNQHISYQGISFQIPKEWKQVNNKSNQSNIFFEEKAKDGDTQGSLTVDLCEDVSMSEEIEELEYAQKINKKKNVDLGELKKESISIANMPAEKIEYALKLGGKKGKVKIILIQTKKDLIKMTFYSISKAGQNDFDQVIQSITPETT